MAGAEGFAESPVIVKVLLGVLIVAVLGAIYYAALHMSLSEELESAKASNKQLLTQRETVGQQRAEYLRLRNELQEREAIDRKNKRVLPETAEIPAVLEDLNQLAEVSGLDIRLVQPMPEKKQELYVRIPVSLSLKGQFHQVARFIYKVSRLERVINMENISLTDPKLEGDDVTLNISVRATTFRRPKAK
ncbi:MAG: type 4a pilus biogenesis protein PilO [Myxococcales bacterium]|nr:type 4a pilus biogenesis protein PilO [Myxococcales bacterium]